MMQLPEDASLGEVWRSQQRTERVVNNLDSKLDRLVSKHEHNQLAAETKTRLVAGETRLNNLDKLTTENSTNLKQLNTFAGWFGSAFVVAVVSVIFTFITV